MSQHDIIAKMNDLMQDAFAECYEYTEVASLFHIIVQNAKMQVDFMCKKISEERKNDHT